MTTETKLKPLSAKLLEKYRYCNVEHDEWWEYTYEDFTTEMREKHHVEVHDLRFSGFWSQGDGASFDYKVRGEDVVPFLRTSGLADHFPMMLKLAEDPSHYMLDIKSYRSREMRYVHSNMVNAEITTESWAADYNFESQALEYAIAEINDAAVGAEFEEFEKAVNEHMRGLMDDLYKRLEEEYDCLTSDEAVEDTIRANEWDLDEEDEEEE